MRLDPLFLVTFLSVFVRMTAVLMAAPFSGHSVPLQVRVFLSAICGLAFAPVVQPYIGHVPDTMFDVVALVGRDALFGLAIGMCLQLVVAIFQMAGSLLDFQMGVSSAQALNPALGALASPVGQLKTMLATVLILMLNGHHLMFQAFLQSYQVPIGSIQLGPTMLGEILTMVGRMMFVAIQVAAPVSAVSLIIDMSAGIINKAVPQTQPFLFSIPAKLGFGMIVLSIGLPTMVAGVEKGMDITFFALHRIMGVH